MNVEDPSLISEHVGRPDSRGELPGESFGAPGDDGEESGTPLGAVGWLRLILAVACVGIAVFLTAHRFVDHVMHDVWNQSRNSPMVLIVPVLAVEFMWIIAHVQTGGPLARLKIGLGAVVFCVALFSPDVHQASGSGQGRSHGLLTDLRQLLAMALAAWVFVDGWLDRRSNLREDQSRDLVGQRP